MNLFKHIYYAVRYGKWHLGWGQYENKPQLGFYYAWYDGNQACVHIYKLYIGVTY
jgi:hypothetical protein